MQSVEILCEKISTKTLMHSFFLKQFLCWSINSSELIWCAEWRFVRGCSRCIFSSEVWHSTWKLIQFNIARQGVFYFGHIENDTTTQNCFTIVFSSVELFVVDRSVTTRLRNKGILARKLLSASAKKSQVLFTRVLRMVREVSWQTVMNHNRHGAKSFDTLWCQKEIASFLSSQAIACLANTRTRDDATQLLYPCKGKTADGCGDLMHPDNENLPRENIVCHINFVWDFAGCELLSHTIDLVGADPGKDARVRSTYIIQNGGNGWKRKKSFSQTRCPFPGSALASPGWVQGDLFCAFLGDFNERASHKSDTELFCGLDMSFYLVAWNTKLASLSVGTAGSIFSSVAHDPSWRISRLPTKTMFQFISTRVPALEPRPWNVSTWLTVIMVDKYWLNLWSLFETDKIVIVWLRCPSVEGSRAHLMPEISHPLMWAKAFLGPSTHCSLFGSSKLEQSGTKAGCRQLLHCVQSHIQTYPPRRMCTRNVDYELWFILIASMLMDEILYFQLRGALLVMVIHCWCCKESFSCVVPPVLLYAGCSCLISLVYILWYEYEFVPSSVWFCASSVLSWSPNRKENRKKEDGDSTQKMELCRNALIHFWQNLNNIWAVWNEVFVLIFMITVTPPSQGTFGLRCLSSESLCALKFDISPSRFLVPFWEASSNDTPLWN